MQHAITQQPSHAQGGAPRPTLLVPATLFMASLLLAGVIPVTHAQLHPGDHLVLDGDAGTNLRGALFRVDPTSGQRTVLSDFGDHAQGALGQNPIDMTIEAVGTVLVLDSNAGTSVRGALFRVHLPSGQRTVLSDFGDPAQGPLGFALQSVEVDGSGGILVIDARAGTNARGALFRVHLPSGQRTVLSDFGDLTQGSQGVFPSAMALEASGTILVSDTGGPVINPGRLLRVDSTTGQRTVLSDFGDPAQGPLGLRPRGVTVEHSGGILVIDARAGTNARGALFRVDPTSGQRTVLSDFGDPAQGALGQDPVGVAIEGPGAILVIDARAGTNRQGALFRVHLPSGQRPVLSDFGDPAQGALGFTPHDVERMW